MLHRVGFGKLQTSATYETYGTPQAIQAWGSKILQYLDEENLIKQFRQLGAEPHELDEMRQAWRAWMDDPAALLADAWVECVGWKAYD